MHFPPRIILFVLAAIVGELICLTSALHLRHAETDPDDISDDYMSANLTQSKLNFTMTDDASWPHLHGSRRRASVMAEIKVAIQHQMFSERNKMSIVHSYKQALSQFKPDTRIVNFGCGGGYLFQDGPVCNIIRQKRLTIHCVADDKSAAARKLTSDNIAKYAPSPYVKQVAYENLETYNASLLVEQMQWYTTEVFQSRLTQVAKKFNVHEVLIVDSFPLDSEVQQVRTLRRWLNDYVPDSYGRVVPLSEVQKLFKDWHIKNDHIQQTLVISGQFEEFIPRKFRALVPPKVSSVPLHDYIIKLKIDNHMFEGQKLE